MFMEASLNSRMLEIMRELNSNINNLIREMGTDFNLTVFAVLVAVSFVYGVVHALGPGHGKAIIASFFFKEEQPLKKSVLMSLIVSFTHTGSAIILSFLLFYILTGIRGMMRIQLQNYFIIASGFLVTMIGLVFLIKKILCSRKIDLKKSENNRNIYLVGLSAGIIPCPVTLMIMTLTISNRIVFAGLAAVVSISIGMFMVLLIVGLLSIYSRSRIISLSGKFLKKTELVSEIVEYLSIVLILLIGLTMATNIFGLL